MEEEEIKEQMHNIKNKIRIIEWDKEHSGTFSREHICEKLREEYKKLKKKLKERWRLNKDAFLLF